MSNQPYPQDPADQGYPQREMAGQPYPPAQSYQQPYYPPDQQGNQAMPPQMNQVPYIDQNLGPSNGIVRTSNMGPLHAESRYETYRDPMGNLVESRQQVFKDQNQVRSNIRYWSTTIISFLLGVLEVILLLRLIFRLLGANRNTGFITFLYGISHPFVAAFNGIFNDQTLGNVGVFESSTLIAIIIYALLAWGLIALIRILFAPVRASRQSVTTTRRGQY